MSLRVVTLIPSATEIVGRLLDDPGQLVGVTHECDFPPWVVDRPRVIRPADEAILDMEPALVDERVTQSIGGGQSLYVIDERLLSSLAPDLVITQRLCDVCAASPAEVQRALAHLASQPTVLELGPMALDDVLDDVARVGQALGKSGAANRWREELESRLDRARRQPRLHPKPKVLALEWPDPLWAGGHWIPEMIALAGGTCVAGNVGEPSTRISWETVLSTQPDFIFLMSCGYSLDKNVEQLPRLQSLPGWENLPAVRAGNVFAVDANSHFSRCGPRLVDGTELLAAVLRGEEYPSESCRRLSP